jgi:predicted acyl esterase
VVKAALQAQDIKAWFARMPWRRGRSPISAAPEYEDYLFEHWSHGTFDEFWKRPGIYAEGYYDRYADVPVVNLSGWYDPYARTALENYLGLSRSKRGPMRLILGPWTHGDRSLSYAGDVHFGAARDGRRQPRRRFLRLAATLVRPLAQGRRERRRGGVAGAHIRHGWRIGAVKRRWPARSWRAVAQRRRLVAAGDAMEEVLSARRPQPSPRAAIVERRAARLPVRSEVPGSDHRRRHQFG